MTDAIEVARQRRKDYENAISKKEAEIEELKELMGDLDSFIEFGEALVQDGTEPEATGSLAELKEVPQSKVTDKEDEKEIDPSQEWNTVENTQGIAKVLAARGS